jgi:hypothetical protein
MGILFKIGNSLENENIAQSHGQAVTLGQLGLA